MKRRNGLVGRTLATLVLCLAPLQAMAQDGGVVLDAPLVRKLPSGDYLFNKPAFERVDAEMKRLQAQERAHKAEPSWATPVLIGLAVGVVTGLAVGLVARSALDALPKNL